MGYHHFIGNGLNRSEKIQAWIVNELLNSKIPNEKRESSIQWELKHSSGVIQLARLLAQKRNLNEELAVVAAGLHDVHVIVNGTYDNHARLGAQIAKPMLEQSGQFSNGEIKQICDGIGNHSDKHLYSSDPFVELIKDADCFDCFFYGDKVYDYKDPSVLKHYYKRIIKIREEAGLPVKTCFSERIKVLGD
ncbi:HD domain-containing protein [Candidatus Micrarchaeota archaeon]|nr:HD domain-containing protein [Candidatus Micrarchaeota archaeon]